MELHAFEPANQTHLSALAALWNAACGPELTITPQAMRFNTLPTTGAVQAGKLALVDGQTAGFVLASAFPDGAPAVSPPEVGWVDAIAVSPHYQHRGLGGALLAWAEGWLAEQGCAVVLLGSSLRPFAPGLPTALGTEGFFRRRGYAHPPDSEREWDVARNLADYTSPPNVRQGLPGEVRPAQPGEEGALLTFLEHEFPGRWHFEFQEFLVNGGRLSDFMVLLTEGGVAGFCQLTFEDSLRPLDRFFMHELPRPWGQLGPIGVSQRRRGAGYGAIVLDAGLRRLHAAGVAGCVIDWTSLLDFYGKFGFQPYREYEPLMKTGLTPDRR